MSAAIDSIIHGWWIGVGLVASYWLGDACASLRRIARALEVRNEKEE